MCMGPRLERERRQVHSRGGQDDTRSRQDNTSQGVGSLKHLKGLTVSVGRFQPLRFWMAAHSSRRPTVRWKSKGSSGSTAK